MRYPAAILLALAFAVPLTLTSASASQARGSSVRKPDLADAVAGIYEGKVIADARGASGTEVEITVTRVGKNLVEVSCDYNRVPTVRIPLIRAMNTIMYGRGHNGFLIDRDKDPRRLDLSIDEVTMLVYKS